MVHLKLLVVFLLGSVTVASNQHLKNIDKTEGFNEGFVAIRKDNSWGFIDLNGTLTIDFRKDIVTSSNQSSIVTNDLFFSEEKRENFFCYDYINAKGETIIPTNYIATTAFKNGFARVIKHYKSNTGAKNILGQNIRRYIYNELVIDAKNETAMHITGPHHLLFDDLKFHQNVPAIRSEFISNYLIALKEDDNTYSLHILKKE